MLKRGPEFALSASLAALVLLLCGAGAGLLVTGSAESGNDLAPILIFVLAMTAGCAVVTRYRTSTARSQQRHEELEHAAARARVEDHWGALGAGADSAGGFPSPAARRCWRGWRRSPGQLAGPGCAPRHAGAGKPAVLGVLVLHSRDAGQLTGELAAGSRASRLTAPCMPAARACRT